MSTTASYHTHVHKRSYNQELIVYNFQHLYTWGISFTYLIYTDYEYLTEQKI